MLFGINRQMVLKARFGSMVYTSIDIAAEHAAWPRIILAHRLL